MAVFLPQSKSRMGAAQTGYTAPRPNPAQSFAAESAKPGYGGYTKPVQQPTRPPMYGSKPMPQKPPMQGAAKPGPYGGSIGGPYQSQFSDIYNRLGQQGQDLVGAYGGYGPPQHTTPIGPVNQMQASFAPPSGGSTQHTLPYWYRNGGGGQPAGMSESTLASAMRRLFGQTL